VHDDLCHVRQLGEELVLSNLVNRGTVLLNYRIGDLGRLVDGRCACGRGLPLLAGIEGRASAVLELPNGALVHSMAVWGALRDLPGILRFQLVQHGASEFELRLVATDAAAFDRLAASAVPRLHDLLGGAAVEATRHEELHPGPSGKFASVVPLSNGARPS
jgi:phenylacetate-coenzyme A ligase PaaK-like adenylate-forming protein